MLKTVNTQGIARLEDQFGRADRRPPRRLRMVVRKAGSTGSLEDATCSRTLWPDGTLFEMVRLDWSDEGPGTLTAKEPHRWVEGFPVLVEPTQVRLGQCRRL